MISLCCYVLIQEKDSSSVQMRWQYCSKWVVFLHGSSLAESFHLIFPARKTQQMVTPSISQLYNCKLWFCEISQGKNDWFNKRLVWEKPEYYTAYMSQSLRSHGVSKEQKVKKETEDLSSVISGSFWWRWFHTVNRLHLKEKVVGDERVGSIILSLCVMIFI